MRGVHKMSQFDNIRALYFSFINVMRTILNGAFQDYDIKCCDIKNKDHKNAIFP